MSANLEAAIAGLKVGIQQLHDYSPADESWQKAEKLVLEVRAHVDTLLHSTEGVKRLRSSGALEEMKRLVPEVTREEIAELKVSDFVLGIIYVKPFMVFDCVYRNFGTEVYGEIKFFPFAEIIRWVAPTLPKFSIFYDLGSGTGKAVIAASLVHSFDQAIGIELLEPLVRCAEKRKMALEKLKSPLLKTDIDFITGSVLTTKWEDGDVIFCHGTCFSDQDWTKISVAAEKLKQGAFFISTTHVLRSGLFEVVKSLNFAMSWGSATLYIHRRRKIGRWAAQMLRGGLATRTDLLQQQPESH